METELSKRLSRGLTDQQRKGREGKLTASQISTLMTGEAHEILNLFKLHIGDPGYEDEDLSQNWNVQRGNATEALNLHFYELEKGYALTKIGAQEAMAGKPDYVSTLDAYDPVESCCVEAKDCGAWIKPDDLIVRYYPQLHWQMLCTGTIKIILRPSIGGAAPKNIEVKFNEEYADNILQRANDYWHCVQNLIHPVMMPVVATPVPVSDMIEVDMGLSNSWAEQASIWVQNQEPAKAFDKSVVELKKLMQPNYGRAYGHGIQIKRSTDNKLLITKTKTKG